MANETCQTDTAVCAPCKDAGENQVVFTPNIDIVEEPQRFLVVADLPGAAADRVDVDYENGELTIHGKITPRGPEGGRFLLREYGVGDFRRSLKIGEAIDSSGITADFRDGVLTLHLPKSAAVRPRKINVAGANAG